jgi:Nuclease-related domain
MAKNGAISTKSPLKGKPLRLPGQSLDEEIDYWLNDRFVDYAAVAGCLLVIAALEWIAYLAKLPRYPILYSVVAASAIGVAMWRFFEVREKIRQLRLGRDGERAVGQFLERLRDGGGQVFHDIPGDGFNLDHVVISPHGLYAVETKTLSKPWPKATITVAGDSLRIAGRIPDRNPIEQVTGAAR